MLDFANAHLRGLVSQSASTSSVGMASARNRIADCSSALGSAAWVGTGETTGPRNTEHIAKVRARRHLDVLDDVAKPRALPLPLLEHEQAGFEQNNIGRFFRNVHCRIN